MNYPQCRLGMRNHRRLFEPSEPYGNIFIGTFLDTQGLISIICSILASISQKCLIIRCNFCGSEYLIVEINPHFIITNTERHPMPTFCMGGEVYHTVYSMNGIARGVFGMVME